MSEAERERAQEAGLDAFEADVAAVNWGGGLDAPTGRFALSCVPDGAKKRADAAAAAAMTAAAVKALGRDAPITAEFEADRDPKSTDPATWFLPAGFVPGPTATSVEVLVNEPSCTSGPGAQGNTAPPEVEVTSAEVRIAVSTYIRKAAQGCPGHPLAPVVVDLGQPLGDRTLVDVNGRVDDGPSGSDGSEMWSDVQVPEAG